MDILKPVKKNIASNIVWKSVSEFLILQNIKNTHILVCSVGLKIYPEVSCNVNTYLG